MLDIINNFIYIYIFVQSIIYIWVIINISLVFDKISDSSLTPLIKGDYFNLDISIKPLKTLISNIWILYTIYVILLSLYFGILSPDTNFTVADPDQLLLICLILVGWFFLLIGTNAIRNILGNKLDYDLMLVYNKYHEFIEYECCVA